MDDRRDSATVKEILVDSEEILDNAVSLSSAVVSEEEGSSAQLTFSSDLLIIATPHTSQNPSPSAGHSDSSSSNLRTQISYTKGKSSPSPGLLPEFIPSKRKNSPGSSVEKGMPPKLSVCSSDDEDGSMQDLISGMKDARKEDRLTYFGYTKKQWLTLIIFALANIFSTTVISIQSPFYPQEAESKGATATEYGLVFGIFQLTMFIMSPIFGTYIGRVNPKVMFNVGIFTTGTCAILFGFLDYIEDRVTFIALSFALRILQGCGDSAFVTSSFTIVAMTFPESIATTFAALETCSGIGLIIGPTVGGALYEVGGFMLPFLSMGSLLFLTAILTYFLLPGPLTNNGGSTADSVSKGFGFFSLIKIPAVFLAAFSIAISASSIGFLNSTLEPHVRSKFALTPIYTGLIFIIDGALYALSAPIWGRLCDKINQPKFITLVGCSLTFIGFLFIGPPPFMPFDTMLWLLCVGLGIHGLGVGATLVSGFIQAMQDAIDGGFPDNVSTYGLVSGLWIAFFALGSFVGPSIGGVLLDNFGFPLASLYVLVSQIVVAFFVIIFICTAKSKRSHYNSLSNAASDPLLSSANISFNNDEKSQLKRKNLPQASYGAA